MRCVVVLLGSVMIGASACSSAPTPITVAADSRAVDDVAALTVVAQADRVLVERDDTVTPPELVVTVGGEFPVRSAALTVFVDGRPIGTAQEQPDLVTAVARTTDLSVLVDGARVGYGWGPRPEVVLDPLVLVEAGR